MKKSELRNIIREEIFRLTEVVVDEKVFDKFVEALRKKNIGALVKLYDTSREPIGVELGYNYPDRLFDKVYDIAESLGLDGNSDIRIMADASGGKILKSIRINGGPRRW